MNRRVAALVLALPAVAAGHPLGNFSTSRYAALLVERDAVRVAYSVDFAELPARREMPSLDTDRDGTASPAERDAYAARQARAIAGDLALTLDGERLGLDVLASRLEITPGAGGLETLRLDATYRAPLPRLAGRLALVDRAFDGRPGWAEIIATPSDGVRLERSTVPARDVSAALRAYPDDLLAEPLRVSTASMRIAPASSGSTPPPSRP